jgi:glycerol-3-phosphate O-acyltransferase/dihydroxyacetone phosphate acyltransferase
MIYHLLLALFKITVKLFFSSFKVKGRANIPSNKPLLIVANHPSTFMDPIVMAIAAKRRVHFIAKGEAFRSKFAQWLLPKFSMIPIYRKEHDPHLSHKNDETFEKVYEILEKGGAVIIFPEGISITDRILKKIKSGTMRMALGAEAKNDFKLDVHILPMGLNFSDPHRFRSKVEVRIGTPIPVREYKEAYLADSMKGIQLLKERVRVSIEGLIFCVDSPDTDQLISRLESIYKRNFLDKENRYHLQLDEEIRISELVRERVNYFIKNDPSRVENMSHQLENHAELMKFLNLDGEVVDVVGGNKLKFTIRDYWYFIIGFPVFLFGLINNYLPYKLPGILANKLNSRADFRGSILMASGTFIFLIFYVIQTILIYHFTIDVSIFITPMYLFLLPITGLFAYYYSQKFKNLKQSIEYNRLKNSGDPKIKSLVDLEITILEDMDSAIKEFENLQVV